jgi:membrane protease YdiL (CAAX protease family)
MHTIANSLTPPGRPAAAPLLTLFRRHPLASAVSVWIVDLLLINGFIWLGARWLPAGLDPSFVALWPGLIVLALFVTLLGWWRAIGFNGPAQWRDLRLLILPAIVVLLLPLLSGIKPLEGGSLFYLIAGYLLVGLREETLYRGVILRILHPFGPLRSSLLMAVLFGLAHLSNLFVRANPAIVVAQAVGAFCDGFGFGALRLRTNTLWFLIALHAAHDLLLRYTNFPAIPLDVVQVTILLIYGIFILRRWREPQAAP